MNRPVENLYVENTAQMNANEAKKYRMILRGKWEVIL